MILPNHLYDGDLLWYSYGNSPVGTWVNPGVIDVKLPIRLWLSDKCYGLETTCIYQSNNYRLSVQVNFKKEEDALLFKLTWL